MKLPKLSIFSFYLLLLVFWGCSTTNRALIHKQAYQDITSHYNAWFNCNEKLQNVFTLSESFHKDKFDSVIPVYFYTSPKEYVSYSSDLDDIIKRSTLAIQLHTAANWTDDHFMLIGEAHFLKGDYDKASSSFKYITTQFKEGVDYVKVMRSLGKKVGKYVPGKKVIVKPKVNIITNDDGTQTLQKVDNRPEISLWIHTPARSEALIWLIKTYTRQKKYEQAATIVNYVRNDNLFYKNFDPDLDLAEADLHVAKKDYAGAIEPLEKYLTTEKIKKKKRLIRRPLFVLAQCYQMTGNSAKAIETFGKVLKTHPGTEMEFYTKLKMAKLSRGGGNSAEIRALLASMAKDFKFKDYWDQVYYELALISLAENNRGEARKFLHKSVSVSTTNSEQKGISFLKLAEMDFEDEAYVTSKFLYDSTLHFMPKTDKQYPAIEERHKVLDNLVKQLNIIAEEDSLQKLAAMSDDEIKKVISDAIAKKEKEEEEAKEAKEKAKQASQLQNFQTLTGQNGNKNPNQLPGGATWYFYSTTARAEGYNDFIKKWGQRDLEEDWRRSNKTSNENAEEAAEATDTTEKKDTTLQVVKGSQEEKLMAGIPLTPEKMQKSVDRIVDAYYAAGTIYKDGLESYAKAEVMFETVNSRYPKHKLLLESYYNLYLIALKQKQNDMVEKYKNLILTEFPESVIAKVLKDPNYVNQAKMKEKAIDDYFSSAYDDYARGKYDSAWYKCEVSDNVFKPNPLSARFQLLEALILSKQNRLGDYVQALNSIVNKSSDTQIKKTAADLLALLNKSKLPQVDLSKDTTRRDSLNAAFAPVATSINASRPDTAELTLLQKLELAKQAAVKSGKFVDTAAKNPTTASTLGKDTAGKTAAPAAKDTAAIAAAMQEDTASPYKRSDDAVHYFLIYINDPTVQESAIMSTMAKVNAFNSTQFESLKLQSHQAKLDSKNKVLFFKQFKGKADIMPYYKAIITQGQLFTDLKPGQFSLLAISTTNYYILIDRKDPEEYKKFFKRVYK